MSDLTVKLQNAAGNLFSLYKRTHVHHINVVGPTFKQDHSFLGELYEQFNDFFDSTAELIRIEGEALDCTFESGSVLPEEFTTKDRTKIFEDILMCLEIVLSSLRSAHEEAVKVNSIGTFTALETTMESLVKTRWMIKSSI